MKMQPDFFLTLILEIDKVIIGLLQAAFLKNN